MCLVSLNIVGAVTISFCVPKLALAYHRVQTRITAANFSRFYRQNLSGVLIAGGGARTPSELCRDTPEQGTKPLNAFSIRVKRRIYILYIHMSDAAKQPTTFAL